MQAVGLFTLSCPGFQCLYQKPLSVTSLCVCSWARVHACVCMHVSHQRSVSGDIPEETSTLFFETKSHTGTWYFPGKLGRLTSKPQGCLHLPSIGITSVCHHSCFVLFILCEWWGLNLCPHDFPTSILPTESSPWPIFVSVKWPIVYDELCFVSSICKWIASIRAFHRVVCSWVTNIRVFV